jgi:hypothetical protein
MKGIPRGRYTKEFPQEAVKLVIEEKYISKGKRIKVKGISFLQNYFNVSLCN